MKTPISLIYSDHALQDLDEIGHFLETERPGAAHAFYLRLETGLSRIRYFPQSGARSSDEGLKHRGLRQLVIDDYLIFYPVMEKSIRIHRVVHGKRDYPHLI